MMDGDGWMWGHGWGWGGWLAMFGMVLFWAVLITAVVLAIRYLSAADRAPGRTLPPPGHTPEDLLAQRFARGEIDEDEYRQRMAVLLEHR
ncbi:MAG: SHOCT domain-containing protein [Mycobacterium sp.]|nr:SHOCT domain-containing protein [Mycobacterium sp.]